jgi:citrate lyase subunit beta/citryl-CoA lyase
MDPRFARTEPMPRSLLYVPASRADLFDKAHQGVADAIVLDLEDAVPLPEKETARTNVRRWLEAVDPAAGAEIWVRVSAEFVAEDVEVAALPAVAGLLVAKASKEVLERVHEELTGQERSRKLDRAVGIVALVETAAALVTLPEMAAHPRVRTFGVGEVDLLADLRMRRTPGTAAAVDSVRLEIVRHAAAAGLAAPVAPTSTDFRDLDAFAASTRHLVDLGFRSRTAVHPAQVPVVNEVLTPDEETLARARSLVALAESAGGGVALDEEGRLVDAAVVREAHEVIARA